MSDYQEYTKQAFMHYVEFVKFQFGDEVFIESPQLASNIMQTLMTYDALDRAAMNLELIAEKLSDNFNT